MACFGYIRTSTNKQNTDRQIVELERVCDKLFIENGVSARKKQRPAFSEMLGEVSDGDIIMVTAYDRAFRSVIDGLNALDQLSTKGVALESLSQRIDPTTPDGRLFFTMTMAMGEWEVNILSQRTIEGLAAARTKGKKLGRPRKPTSVIDTAV